MQSQINGKNHTKTNIQKLWLYDHRNRPQRLSGAAYHYDKEFRQNIVSVRHHIQHDDLIDKFVVECYSLLNYLTNITFPVTEIESARQTMGLDCPSTLEKILFLESIADKYSGVLSDLLSSIFCVVRKAYRAVGTINPKKAPPKCAA